MKSLPRHTLTSKVYESEQVVLYRGVRDDDGAQVAVKIWKDEYPTPKELARIRHEHAILASLDLPGVVKAYALEKHGNSLAIVMEDFGGQPLSDFLHPRRLDLATSLRIATSIADTLESIHRRRILHKDIKPQNILVNPTTGEVKLTDFGIAAPLAREAHLAAPPDALEGTLAYMAPEQTGRVNRVVDARSDLYALGVTLYELFTGSLPFTTTDPAELVHSHIARKPPPPRALAPELPEIVSSIVLKLLAKAAEDRYQRAAGLKADLLTCLDALEATGEIAPFPLGRRDVADEVRLPQKLYGREAELHTLMSAWERATQGSAELVLISGQAGIGKTALVNELYASIAQRRGYFISGKFEQLRQSRPYASITQALAELIRQILTESPASLARWRATLGALVGASGRVLVELLPEAEILLGPQPAAPALSPAETQNRLGLLFERFLKSFASAEHPLVLLLNDLQWADPASLKLLRFLLSDASAAQSHLLVVGTYRDSEIDAAHPLTALRADLIKAGTRVQEIALGPLSQEDVGRLVVDALSLGADDAERTAPLASLAWEKTQGNPFFLHQFLTTLARAGLLVFDEQQGTFAWSIAEIKQLGFTDNVVELMVRKLGQLGAATRRALESAACIGHQFDVGTLAAILDSPERDVADALWEALKEGLIAPVDAEYRFFHTASSGFGASEPPPSFHVRYTFLHDRVQQAAYSLLDEAQKRQTHLAVGRHLLARHGGRPEDKALFLITDQLNLGAALIVDPVEQIQHARLNLATGARAKAGAAFEAAAGYFKAGRLALGGGGWERDRALLFELGAELAECQYLTGAFTEAEALFEELLASARSLVDEARIQTLRITLYTTQGKFAEALRVGLAALKRFGVEVPDDDGEALQAATQARLAELEAAFGGRSYRDLLDAPTLTDPEMIARLRLALEIGPAVYIVRPAAYALMIANQMIITLRHGNCPLTPTTYVAYGSILAGVMGRYKDAHECGMLALELAEKLDAVHLRTKLHCLFATHISYFRDHHRVGLDHLWRGHDAGLDSGDFIYLSYICHGIGVHLLLVGEELSSVDQQLSKLLVLMQRTKDALSTMSLRISRQVAACLSGRTEGPTSFSNGDLNEAEFAATLEGAGFSYIAFHYYALKAKVLYLHGDFAGALSMGSLADKAIGGRASLQLALELTFYTALALSALRTAPLSGAEREGYLADLALHEGRLAAWAESCPANFRHQQELVLAERARVCGADAEAIDLYDRAIAGAREGEFVHEEALANELAAKYHLAKGRTKVAQGYMAEAHYAYLCWGASAKASALAAAYPHLLPRAGAPSVAPEARLSSGVTLTTISGPIRGTPLDAAAVLRGVQAIAGEIELTKAVDRLLRIVVENAGAQRAVLLLERDEELWIEATMRVDPDEVRVGIGLPAREGREVPLSIVQYVERTREPVVLGDATRELRFAADPYLIAARPRSVLCLAMAHQGRLSGILYLENSASADVFTPARSEICGILAAQAATAVENALLYDRVQRVNEVLEREVARRTDELRAANEKLQVELVERARAEEARAALQEEVIRVQRSRLEELSTPMIPITRGIMVMPLIGTMDDERAEQVLVNALHGVEATEAVFVIIDITGVTTVDTGVASTLLRTATALGLLGTQVVITGVRAKIAQTLVDLDIDLGSIVTKGTLESGIAYALRRAGDPARSAQGGAGRPARPAL